MSKLTFEDYQDQAIQTAIYPDRYGMGGLTYAVLGLTNEAGEVAGKLKKILRDGNGELTEVARESLLAELGDVVWYLALVADELSEPLENVAQANLDKLNSRKERGVLGGSGDNR